MWKEVALIALLACLGFAATVGEQPGNISIDPTDQTDAKTHQIEERKLPSAAKVDTHKDNAKSAHIRNPSKSHHHTKRPYARGIEPHLQEMEDVAVSNYDTYQNLRIRTKRSMLSALGWIANTTRSIFTIPGLNAYLTDNYAQLPN